MAFAMDFLRLWLPLNMVIVNDLLIPFQLHSKPNNFSREVVIWHRLLEQ